MSGRVDGKVVVVSGAGRGQGAAEARLLACEGATVVAVDLADVPGEDLKAAEYRRLDVTDAEAWAVLAAELGERHGRVDGFAHACRLLDRHPVDGGLTAHGGVKSISDPTRVLPRSC